MWGSSLSRRADSCPMLLIVAISSDSSSASLRSPMRPPRGCEHGANHRPLWVTPHADTWPGG